MLCNVYDYAYVCVIFMFIRMCVMFMIMRMCVCNIYVYAYVHMCAGASGLRRTWQWLSILEGCFCLVILSGCQHPAVETVFLGFKMIMMIFFRL